MTEPLLLCSNPLAQYLAHRAEIDAAVRTVLERGIYVLGAEVKAFEAELAAYAETAHAVGVNSGTDALRLALSALGVGPGDEVIAPSHTAVATVAAIELAGASAVLVDVDPQTYTMAPAAVRAAVGPRTRAIVAVHLYGQGADVDALLAIAAEHRLRVVEDCAQAHGARVGGRRVGAIGDVGCFSFYPTKNLGAIGDGGAVVTSDPVLANRVRQLREYGWVERTSEEPGINSRLDELQAAVLRVKLRHLDADNARRARVADVYDRGLAKSSLVLPARRDGGDHVFHLYVARTRARAALMKHLREHGVAAGVHYPVPVHLQPAYRGRLRTAGGLAETERAAAEVISLPMYPELTDAECERVIRAVRAFEGRKDGP